ncbi:MAG TPA: AMP-binding protein [Ramlibacter sp.]|nr:AMP-binding protein [Ramlibacter sp.]
MAVAPDLNSHDAIAIAYGDRRITYGELAQLIARAAAKLWHARGVRPQDRVAWLGANDPAQIVLLFALARIGAMLLPLNTRLAPAEWDALLAQCAPKLMVHDNTWAQAASDAAQRNGIDLLHARELQDACGTSAAPDHAEGDAPVLLVFTSGTTGRPKAAMHTQANLAANMRIAAQMQRIERSDRIATMLPLFHVGGLCIQTLPALGAGAQVILLPRFSPDDAFDCFERERPTLTLQVPATMKALIDHPRWQGADLSSLRAVWAGSSLIPSPLVEAFHARGLPVCNVYGSTETGPFSIALPPDKAMEKVGSCGWPAPEVKVLLGHVKDGVGEVLVRAPNVVQRYWPDEPACDAQGFFHTGDLARQDADGSFSIVGRAKDLIISGGENIHPAEIEQALALHPDVLECAAFGVADAQWGEAVAVAVVRRPGNACAEDELLAHLQSRIARYKLPRRWLWLDALPKTALGKVQRGELARILQARG